MGTFRHTLDDSIYINSTSMPLSFFITLVPTYALPAGAIRAEYTQGVSYVASSATSIISSSTTYTDGDIYIANESAYAAAYASYLNPAPSLSQAKASKISEMIVYGLAIKLEHVMVTISATPYEFFSDSMTLDELMRMDAMFTRSSMPVGFYVNDVTYAQIVMPAISDFESIIDRIIGLYYLVDLNINVHRAAINALSSVPAVNAYVYTTGWPTTPY